MTMIGQTEARSHRERRICRMRCGLHRFVFTPPNSFPLIFSRTLLALPVRAQGAGGDDVAEYRRRYNHGVVCFKRR